MREFDPKILEKIYWGAQSQKKLFKIVDEGVHDSGYTAYFIFLDRATKRRYQCIMKRAGNGNWLYGRNCEEVKRRAVTVSVWSPVLPDRKEAKA